MASTSALPPAKSRVLVCGDLFDKGGSHWQQSMGLGEFIDTDPPPQTVFFVGRVKKHVAGNEAEVYFTFDRSRTNVKPEQICKVIGDEARYPPFWVFRHNKTGVFKVSGVTFEKAGADDVRMPQRFDTNDPGDATPKRNPINVIAQMVPGAPRRRLRRRATTVQPNNEPVAAVAATATAVAATATANNQPAPAPNPAPPHTDIDGNESDASFETDNEHEQTHWLRIDPVWVNCDEGHT